MTDLISYFASATLMTTFRLRAAHTHLFRSLISLIFNSYFAEHRARKASALRCHYLRDTFLASISYRHVPRSSSACHHTGSHTMVMIDAISDTTALISLSGAAAISQRARICWHGYRRSQYLAHSGMSLSARSLVIRRLPFYLGA